MSKPNLPPLAWLRAFEAAARHLSFTVAANELNMTQAAISKQVKSLEFHLRHQLFERRPRSLVLTKTGMAYLPKVRDAFDRLAVGTHEVFGQRKNEALTLRCTVSFATNWLAPRLPNYLKNQYGRTLRIISSIWNDVYDHDRFDLEIQYGLSGPAGVVSQRLRDEKIMPLCSPDLMAKGPFLTANDLAQHQLLHVLGYQEGWGSWLAGAQAEGVDQSLGVHFDTSATALEVAACGGGVVLGRTSLAANYIKSKRLVRPFKLELPVSEGFYLLRPAASSPHPDADEFCTWLLKSFTEESLAIDNILSE
jgi:LysR family glycine cleavage system transcriptional activator